MIVGTTEAAKILKISTARLRMLLSTGRVRGAYKTGRMWLMPLVKGKPIIERRNRGPAPRWKNPRVPAKTVIHVNRRHIQINAKKGTVKKEELEPVISVKKPGDNKYAHAVEIPGGCRVVYSPKGSSCGAKVWIETFEDVHVITWT